MIGYVAAFRTYTWDNDVRELAERFFAACPNARQVILADESRGSLGITGYEVISHTKETEDLGLIVEPRETSLWFNVDYGAYILRNALPDYRYYLLSESDLAVNVGLETMVVHAAERGIDAVLHEVQPAPAEWCWLGESKALFDEPLQSLLFFMLLSDAAIDLLWMKRRELGRSFRQGTVASWPFCEAFVPSTLKAHGMHLAEVREFFDTFHLRYRPRISLDDPRANQPGTLVHSVLGRDRFIRSIIEEGNPRDFFYPGSDFAMALAPYPLSCFATLLDQKFTETRDYAASWKLSRMTGAATESADPVDLAYRRPALSSSTSKWSNHEDPRQDASGANGEFVHDDLGFHTQEEDAPWWMVDLLAPAMIDRISIVNRSCFGERFVNFMVETSTDSSLWTIAFVKLDVEPVSADLERPFVIPFEQPILARFVRIRMIGRGILHLRRVGIWGCWALSAA